MPKRNPRVSIGVPVYNGSNYLSAALDSLLGQSYGDFELIISDNASTDNTAEICREYASSDKRIHYVRHERNLGIAANFNAAFRLSRGEYFKWAAHDDLCDRSFLAQAVSVLDSDPEVVLCASKTALVDSDGVVLCSSPHDASTDGPVLPSLVPRHFDADLPHQRFYDILINTMWGIEFYGLIRSRILRTTRLHRPYCLAEKVLLAELALHGRFFEIPELLLFMRYHAQQTSQIGSAREQHKQVAGPQNPHSVLPFRVHSCCGYLDTILRSGLPLVEKMRCLQVLASYLGQVRKWKRVITEAVTGKLAITGKTCETDPFNATNPRRCCTASGPRNTRSVHKPM